MRRRPRSDGPRPGTAAPDARYLAILEQQTDLISRFRADGTMLYVNAAFCRYFGRAREEIVGRAWHPVAHPDDVPMIEARLATLSARHPLVVIENRVRVAGGQMRWCQFVNTAIVDAAGRIVEVQSVGRDVTERKTLELELAAAVAETSDLYENAPCGYWSLEADGTIARINATALAWLGCTREEVVGTARITDFFDADGVQLFRRAFPEFQRSGALRDLEFRLVGRAGGERRVSVSATAVRGSDGRFLMSRSVAFDVTALRDAQDALRRLTERQAEMLEAATRDLRLSQARTRAIFDAALDAIVTLDRGWTVVDANPAAAALFGRSPARMIGIPLATLIPPRPPGPDGAGAGDPLDPQAGRVRQLVARRADGVEFPVEASVSRVSIAGEPLDTIIMRDVTQRLQAQEALLAGKAKLEAALASMSDAACVTDAQGRLVEFNDAFRVFHRCPRRDDCPPLLAAGALQMHSPEGWPLPPPSWPVARALRGETGSGVEYTLRRTDTGDTWVGSYSFAPIRGAAGQLLGAVVTARDVTASRRVEAELKSSREDLRRLISERDRAQEDERRRIAMELHDDLQQTLATIHLNVTALADRLPAEDDAARRILRDLDGLAATALQSTRRIVADLRPPTLDELGLVAALEEMVDRANRHAGARHSFRCRDIDDAGLRRAPELANCIYRVAQEALHNAAKHARARSVAVELSRSGDDLLALRVRDDGRGIGARSEGADRALGLLGMKERARAVGGSLAVFSAPGKGTTVELLVPAPGADGTRDPP